MKHILQDGDLKCLVGYAGTGKSHLLAIAKAAWERDGFRVHGATLSGIAAENLEKASGIESRTLASRCYCWDKGEELLSNKDVLVIDEAGLLDSRQVAKVIEQVTTRGAKAVLIGDPQQLQAIEAGAAFRAISKRVGYGELTEIKRQEDYIARVAVSYFAEGKIEKALELHGDCGHVQCHDTQKEAKYALVERWNSDRAKEPKDTQIIMAYTRRDADELNEIARVYKKERQELRSNQMLATARGEKEFAIGDRVYFLQNERSLGVKNGTLGTIEMIVAQKEVVIKLDPGSGTGKNKYAAINLDHYNHITHGYAATIHKAQGVTVDKSYLLASRHLDRHAGYVGMSRHRSEARLFWSKEEFASKHELISAFSRDRSKDVTLDYEELLKREEKDQPYELRLEIKALQAEATRQQPELVPYFHKDMAMINLLTKQKELRAQALNVHSNAPKIKKV